MEQDKLEKPTSYENLEEMNIKGWLSLVLSVTKKLWKYSTREAEPLIC